MFVRLFTAFTVCALTALCPVYVAWQDNALISTARPMAAGYGPLLDPDPVLPKIEVGDHLAAANTSACPAPVPHQRWNGDSQAIRSSGLIYGATYGSTGRQLRGSGSAAHLFLLSNQQPISTLRSSQSEREHDRRIVLWDLRRVPVWYPAPWLRLALTALAATIPWAAWTYLKRWRLHIKFAERERIARELHDTLLQDIQGLILVMDHNSQGLHEPVAREFVTDCAEKLRVAVEDARERVNEIRPQSRGALEWVGTMSQLSRAAARDHAAVFEFKVEGDPIALRREVSEELIQIAREMLLNAFRHADATAVLLVLDFGKKQFALYVRDNGAGLPPDVLAEKGRRLHWGIQGMRERAAELGGRFYAGNNLGGGTEVRIGLPASRAYLL